MRLFTSVLASVAMIFAASAASAAVSFSATATSSSGNALDALLPGDLVTIDIRVSSTGSPAVAGLGAAITGYDSGVADFVSGNAVASILHDVCVPGFGCFSGLDNQIGGVNPLSEGSVAAGPFVQIFNGVSLTARTGTGALDAGLDGVVGGGDAQFRVVFAAAAPGTTTFNIGTNSSDPILGNAVVFAGGQIGDATNASIAITVVPEPGTALLMGLGLAGLAAAGRRR